METFSALLALCVGNSPVTGEFPAQRPVTRDLMFSLRCVWINGWVKNVEAGDLKRYRAHYDVIVMCWSKFIKTFPVDYLCMRLLKYAILLRISDSLFHFVPKKCHFPPIYHVPFCPWDYTYGWNAPCRLYVLSLSQSKWCENVKKK